MRKSLRLVAGVLLGGSALAAMPALAQTALQQDMAMQDMGTMTVGETVISLGGGFAYLTLPDTRFTFRYKDSGNFDTISKQKNDAFDEYGGGFSGTVSTPLGGAFGMPWVGAVHGYWSSIDNTNRNRCVTTNSSTCAAANIVDTPGSLDGQRPARSSRTPSRDVDSWGVALEFTTPNPRPMMMPGIMKSTHWGWPSTCAASTRICTSRAAFAVEQLLQLQGDARYHLLRRLFHHRRRVLALPRALRGLGLALLHRPACRHLWRQRRLQTATFVGRGIGGRGSACPTTRSPSSAG